MIETDASQQGWWAVCKEVRTGGLWSQNERLLHINCLELLAGAFAVKCFTKNQICLHVRLRMDNTTATAYLNKLGGTRSLVLSNLAAELWSWALNRGMILSAEHLPGKWNTQADQESRHYQDSSDWHLDSSLFLALMKIRGPCQIDLFANRLNAQLPAFFSWKPDPQGLASDAFQQAWNTWRNYAFPPFCLIMKTLAKLREEGGNLILITPVLANTTLVPSATRHVNSPTSASSSGSQAFDQPSGGPASASSEQNSVSSRMACIQQSISTRGISDRAYKLILASRRPGTNTVYNSAWSKWYSWCKEREVDPLCPDLGNITEFLSDSFHNGLQYRTINTYHSALSNVLPPMEGFPVGQHPLVVRLMKGIQNSRPAMPRYQLCWDINQVLGYIKSLPANIDLSMDKLTGKLATLMAITAQKRSSELGLLDLNFSKKHPEGISFSLPGMIHM